MCADKPLERVNYVYGQILTVDDFTTEQSYFLERLRRHNRHLHGWGVVSGLTVSVQDATIFVEPGVAIDCAGNEIHLCSGVRCTLPGDARRLYVTVEFLETPVGLVPIPGEPANADADPLAYTRIREGCQVDLARKDPHSRHAGMGPGTPGCGSQHPITIARLLKAAKGWKVVPLGRR
jgi:hypothetical protein